MERVGWSFRTTPPCGPFHRCSVSRRITRRSIRMQSVPEEAGPSLAQAASPSRRNTLFIGQPVMRSRHQLANRWWDDDKSAATAMGDLNNGVSQFSASLAVPSSVPDDNANGCVEEAAGSASGGNQPARRPRGRPRGSKNKPKPQAIVERDSVNALHCQVLNVAAGADVVAVIEGFFHRRRIGATVLCASGTIASARIDQLQGFDGRCLSGDIVSLFGTFLPATETRRAEWTSLKVHLAAGQGQVVGGSVTGKLIAAGPVVIMAATFSSYPCERLPLPDVDESNAAAQQTAGRNYGCGVSAFDLAAHFGAPPINLLLNGRQDMLGGPWDSRAPRPHPF